MATKRTLDGSAPSVHPDGRPPALETEYIVVLHDVFQRKAQSGYSAEYMVRPPHRNLTLLCA